MNRRKLLGLSLAAFALAVGPVFAGSYSDDVVAQLKRRGFNRITVGRTFLGRIRIVAVGNGGRREIILNPKTGEILRDLWTANSFGSDGASSGGVLSNSGSSGNSGDNGSDDDDDEGGQDDDHDSNDDNSGSGRDDDDDDDDSSGSDSSDDDD